MTRSRNSAAAFVCVALATTLFISCEKEKALAVEDNTPTSAEMSYKLSVNDEMLNTLDLTVEYHDADGQVQREKLTEKSWEKSVKMSLPAEGGARLIATVKPDYNPEENISYDLAYSHDFKVNILSVTGKRLDMGTMSQSNRNLTIGGNQLGNWLNTKKSGLISVIFVLDRGGEDKQKEW